MVLQLKDGKVQIRSKSRLGRGDLGANSVRITDALQFINNYVKTKSKL